LVALGHGPFYGAANCAPRCAGLRARKSLPRSYRRGRRRPSSGPSSAW